jgi:hypothetical protein
MAQPIYCSSLPRSRRVVIEPSSTTNKNDQDRLAHFYPEKRFVGAVVEISTATKLPPPPPSSHTITTTMPDDDDDVICLDDFVVSYDGDGYYLENNNINDNNVSLSLNSLSPPSIVASGVTPANIGQADGCCPLDGRVMEGKRKRFHSCSIGVTDFHGLTEPEQQMFETHVNSSPTTNGAACVLFSLNKIFARIGVSFQLIDLFIAAKQKFLSEGHITHTMALIDHFATVECIRFALKAKFNTYEFYRIRCGLRQVSVQTQINYFAWIIPREHANDTILIVGRINPKLLLENNAKTTTTTTTPTPSCDHCCAVVNNNIYDVNFSRARKLTRENLSLVFTVISRVYRVGGSKKDVIDNDAEAASASTATATNTNNKKKQQHVSVFSCFCLF